MLSIQYSDKKLNHTYKGLFFCCATTSLITSICQVLYAPVLTPKFFGIVVTGIAKDLGAETNVWFFQLAVIMLTNSQLCCLAFLIFQFSHLTPNCMWSKLGKNTHMLFLAYFVYLICMIVAVIANTRKHVSEQTYKLEKAMFRTFIFKTAMMFFFYFIPLFIYGISIWTEIDCPLLLILINIIYISHGCVSYIVSFFFVGPYRKLITKLIKHKFSISGFSTSATTSSVSPSDKRTLSIRNNNNIGITKSNSGN
uniref:Uncharacterized protein n=1 Tax=Panagrolaimus sp. PS1159 TaxID=55785 RepID=A0AC35GCN3_9BILA